MTQRTTSAGTHKPVSITIPRRKARGNRVPSQKNLRMFVIEEDALVSCGFHNLLLLTKPAKRTTDIRGKTRMEE